MLNLFAQSQVMASDQLMGGSISEEIMVVCVVLIVASIPIALGICYMVTRAIMAIRITSIQAKLTEKLVREGLPEAQIKRLLQANRTGLKEGSAFALKDGWRKPHPTPGAAVSKPGTI